MRTLIAVCIVVVCLAACSTLTGCEGCQQTAKKWESYTAGLDRVIILYANDGSVIKRWEGEKYNVQYGEGGSARFIHQGKVVRISGTYIIEEK